MKLLHLLALPLLLLVVACGSSPAPRLGDIAAQRTSTNSDWLYTIESEGETLSERLEQHGYLRIGRHIAIDCSGTPPWADPSNVCSANRHRLTY